MLQDSPEWHQARLGKLTASRFSDAVAQTRTGWGASRARYQGELISERLTGKSWPRFQSQEMQQGKEREPVARAGYEFRRQVEVVEVGFIEHPHIMMTGCSPDGLVGDDGLIEIKCPSVHTHLATLRGTPIAAEYLAQCHWQMICCQRSWCDFISYCPDLPTRMQMFRQRLHASDTIKEKMETEAVQFLYEIDKAIEYYAACDPTVWWDDSDLLEAA